MTQKERLVELLIWNELRGTPEEAANELQERADYFKPWAEKCADYLISNGVIVPPCKVGDTFYKIDRSFFDGDLEIIPFTVAQINLCHLASESIIEMRIIDKHESFIWVQEEDIPRYFFTTKEEAEQALKERRVSNDGT